MRLFVALWPPPGVIEHLTGTLAALPEREAPAVRWAQAGQLHLTLAFLGEVSERRRAELEVRLGRVAGRYPPIGLGLAGAGRFGDRVLFVRVTGDRERLHRLAGSVSAAARRAGLDVGERSFRAHVTVARARPFANLRPLAAALDGYRSEEWTATGLQLVHSRLGAGPGGRAAYEIVAVWPLTGRNATAKEPGPNG